MSQQIRAKIVKPAGVEPEELEVQVATYLSELEQNQELKQDLRGLQINAAKEVLHNLWIGEIFESLVIL